MKNIDQTQAAIVTGASSGIGMAVAKMLLKAGVKVLATARSSDKLQQLKSRYPECEIVVGDIADEKLATQGIGGRYLAGAALIVSFTMKANGLSHYLATTPISWRNVGRQAPFTESKPIDLIFSNRDGMRSANCHSFSLRVMNIPFN